MTKAREKRSPARAARRAPSDLDVLRAAARLFRAQGFAGTTVREIAAEAGILPGSLHYRYPTKEDVFLALVEAGIARASAEVEAAVAGADGPLERLRSGLRAHLSLLLSGEDAVYVLLNEWRALEGPARRRLVRLRDRYEARWAALLEEALSAGLARPGVDPKLVRLFGFGAINGIAEWYRPGLGSTPDELADAFFELLALGALADPLRPAFPRRSHAAAQDTREPDPRRTAVSRRRR